MRSGIEPMLSIQPPWMLHTDLTFMVSPLFISLLGQPPRLLNIHSLSYVFILFTECLSPTGMQKQRFLSAVSPTVCPILGMVAGT